MLVFISSGQHQPFLTTFASDLHQRLKQNPSRSKWSEETVLTVMFFLVCIHHLGDFLFVSSTDLNTVWAEDSLPQSKLTTQQM